MLKVTTKGMQTIVFINCLPNVKEVVFLASQSTMKKILYLDF